MWNPSTLAGSIMPGYKWLFDNSALDISDIEGKMKVMQTLGVPYRCQLQMLKNAIKEQSQRLKTTFMQILTLLKVMKTVRRKLLKRRRFVPMHQREIVALIAYIFKGLEQILK
jgi:cytochrome c oxidase cbb3-type subunit I/II